jgi:hypothetical protein
MKLPHPVETCTPPPPLPPASAWKQNKFLNIREKRNAYRLLERQPEGKRPLGKLRRRLDNIRMDLGEIGWDVHWICLAQNRDKWRALVNSAMNL